MATFSKLLSKTDINKRLSVPTKYLKSLPSFKGGHHIVNFQAMDEGDIVWTFSCSIRKKGRYKKPVISRSWLEFVRSKNLNVGDRIKFWREKTLATRSHIFRVEAEKEIKIFGVIFGYASSVDVTIHNQVG